MVASVLAVPMCNQAATSRTRRPREGSGNAFSLDSTATFIDKSFRHGDGHLSIQVKKQASGNMTTIADCCGAGWTV